MYAQNPNMGKPSEKVNDMPLSLSFLLIYAMQIQKGVTHYGLVNDIVLCMDAIGSYISFVILQYLYIFLLDVSMMKFL